MPGKLLPVARSHSFAPFRACAGRSEHVSSAASGRCSRIYPSRGLVESLVCVPPSPVRRRLLARLLRSFSTCFRRVLTSPSLHRDFFPHTLLSRRPHRESILRTSLFTSPRECPAHFAVSPAVGVSRARHKLPVTFEMLGLCCCPDVMSSSSWILSLRSVDGELNVELGTVRVPLEMSSHQLLVHELSL